MRLRFSTWPDAFESLLWDLPDRLDAGEPLLDLFEVGESLLDRFEAGEPLLDIFEDGEPLLDLIEGSKILVLGTLPECADPLRLDLWDPPELLLDRFDEADPERLREFRDPE